MLTFLYEMSSSPNIALRESSLNIFTYVVILLMILSLRMYYSSHLFCRSFPGIFGSHEAQYIEVIHQLLFRSLSDADKSVRAAHISLTSYQTIHFVPFQISFLAVKAVTAFIRNHEKDQKTIMNFRDCLPLLLKVRLTTSVGR